MSATITLVTGANRGIGKGLVAALLKSENATVIAAVRNPDDESSKGLQDLPKAEGSRLIIVKVDSGSELDAALAAETLSKQFNISYIDTVIANAGISKYYGPAATTPIAEVREHFVVNALGPLILFQAFWPLLEKSTKPKFVAISTGGASITDMGDIPLPVTAYGSSKAALNYIIRKIHFENENLIAFPISPGWVQTEMGNAGATASGMKEAPVTLADSVDGILRKIEMGTRKEMGGTFQSFDDTKFNW